MRPAGLGLLAALSAGCNAIFGLEPTVAVDASGGELSIDAPLPVARLTWLVAVTDADGNPVAQPETPDIVPAPVVQIGRLDGPLTSASYRAGGYIDLPYDFAGSPWRLAYEAPGELPARLQWSVPADRVGHAVVPRFGRLDVTPIPPSASYRVSPTGTPTSYPEARLFTTGVWLQGGFGSPQLPLDVSLGSAVALGGVRGAPEPARNDLVVIDLVRSFSTGSELCWLSDGAATFSVGLVDGPATPSPQPALIKNNAQVVTVTGGHDLTTVARAGAGLGATGPITRRVMLGRTASVAMPGFTVSLPARHTFPRVDLPMPVLMTLADCINPSSTVSNQGVWTSPSFEDPATLNGFPRLAHVQLSGTRTTPSGAVLRGGLAARGPSPFVFDFDVAFAKGLALGGVDLTQDDAVQLPAGVGPLTLELELEPLAAVPHYIEVILHQVTTTLTPARVYTITGTEVVIDRAVLTAGTEYVFEIRSFRGAPLASVGDFTTYDGTQLSAVTFTRTFRAP